MWKIILILTSGEFAHSSGNPCLREGIILQDLLKYLAYSWAVYQLSWWLLLHIYLYLLRILYNMYVKSWCSRCFHWDCPRLFQWIHVFSSQHEKKHSLQLPNYPWPGQAFILSSESATTMNVWHSEVEIWSAFLLEGIMPKQTFRSFHEFQHKTLKSLAVVGISLMVMMYLGDAVDGGDH